MRSKYLARFFTFLKKFCVLSDRSGSLTFSIRRTSKLFRAANKRCDVACPTIAFGTTEGVNPRPRAANKRSAVGRHK